MKSLILFFNILIVTIVLATENSTIGQTIGQTTAKPIDLLSLTNANQTCSVVLANNRSFLSLRQTFKSFATNLKLVVYFNIMTTDSNGSNVSVSMSGPDTFSPGVWAWATSKGKNLLRMPLDYNIMSLGLLTINTYKIDVVLDGVSGACLAAAPYEYASHLVAKFIAENITENGTTVGMATDGPVVCRSAFAFSHRMFGERGIGFKCCSPPLVPGEMYVCQTPYTTSWEIIWYGPVVLLCWIYAIAFIHFYRLYRYSFVKRQIRQLSGVEKTILEIKQDVVRRIVTISNRFAMPIRDPDELLALRERVGFLDAFGVTRPYQHKLTIVSRITTVVLALTIFYATIGVFIDQYRIRLRDVLQMLDDTPTVYLNVIGHMGWLFCRRELAIYYFAVFETIYSILIPFFFTVVYVFIVFKEAAGDFADPNKTSAVEPGRLRRLLLRFVDSNCGRVFHIVCLFVLVIYAILIAGVFVAYVVYFVTLGIFANIEIVSPWIMPMIISINFIATAFDPVYYHYTFYKEMLFGLCLDDFKQLTIRRQKEIFLPRALLETLYIPKSRELVYMCILRVLWVMAFVILLLLVILTLQHPYYHQMDSIVSFLGIQVVFVLPLLAQLMYNNNRYSSLQETIIKRDVTLYIKNYLKRNPIPIVSSSTGNGEAGDEGGGGEETENGEEEDGEINEGYEAGLKPASSGPGPIVTGGQKVLEMNGVKNYFK